MSLVDRRESLADGRESILDHARQLSREVRPAIMGDPVFIPPGAVLTLEEIGRLTGASLPDGCDASRTFGAVAGPARAGPRDVTVCRQAECAATRAGACFVTLSDRGELGAATLPLITEHPAVAFAKLVAFLHSDLVRPGSAVGTRGISRAAFIHPEARLEDDVTIDPGVVVGPGAEIGSGTVVGANSVVAAQVRIGRHCAIGAHVTIAHALLGNAVVVHPGVRIGQDAVAGAWAGLGRVIVQDRVEIGANTTIERGGFNDTVLGEGCRIASLVHVRRDTVIDREAALGRG